jgi:hypothetical protein
MAAHLYLPMEHTDADLVLAGQIAESVDSAELYVVWTAGTGHAAPEVVAELRTAAPSAPSAFFQAIRELWAALRYKPAPGPRTSRRRPAASREPAA